MTDSDTWTQLAIYSVLTCNVIYLNILCPLDITCDNFVSRRICAAKVISLFFIHDVCVFYGVLGCFWVNLWTLKIATSIVHLM